MKPDVQPRLFTYEEAGKYLGVSAATVKKLAQAGRLTVVKLGKAARIDRRHVPVRKLDTIRRTRLVFRLGRVRRTLDLSRISHFLVLDVGTS